MPRKKTMTYETENLPFAVRLRELREEKGCSLDKVAAACEERGVKLSRQSIGYYEIGQSEPSARTLNCLADFYGVSVGYITGNEDTKTVDITKRAVIDYIGLSEKAIDNLLLLKDEGQQGRRILDELDGIWMGENVAISSWKSNDSVSAIVESPAFSELVSDLNDLHEIVKEYAECKKDYKKNIAEIVDEVLHFSSVTREKFGIELSVLFPDEKIRYKIDSICKTFRFILESFSAKVDDQVEHIKNKDSTIGE